MGINKMPKGGFGVEIEAPSLEVEIEAPGVEIDVEIGGKEVKKSKTTKTKTSKKGGKGGFGLEETTTVTSTVVTSSKVEKQSSNSNKSSSSSDSDDEIKKYLKKISKKAIGKESNFKDLDEKDVVKEIVDNENGCAEYQKVLWSEDDSDFSIYWGNKNNVSVFLKVHAIPL